MSTLYISTVGSDITGDGTLDNPYATINKCLEVCTDGDTIKALSGTYTINSTINITKGITITSNTGINTDVIFTSPSTSIFNIQSNNTSITYLTLQGTTWMFYPVYKIDSTPNESNIVVFLTNNTLSNCIIRYIINGIFLDGTFNVLNNTFIRYGQDTDDASIINIFTCRNTCNIKNNTFIDSESVRYIIGFTNNFTVPTNIHKAHSKGGIIDIADNIVNYTNTGLSTCFIKFDYFNVYIFPDGPDESYNYDTRLSLLVHNNNLSFGYYSDTFNIATLDDISYHMFALTEIYNNTNNFTDHGALHLDIKTGVFSTFITISQIDLDRPIFYIHDNVLSSGNI